MTFNTCCISKRVAQLSDNEVLDQLNIVIGSRRQITAELVAYLGEVEARRLELREAYSSMHDFCCRGLRLSEGSAHRHLVGARTAREFPVVLELLRDGRIHLTGLAMLSKYLTAENHVELLAEACGRSKAELELLIRSRFPKPDVPDAICPMPVRATHAGDSDHVQGDLHRGKTGPAETHAPATRPRVSPLSAERFAIQFSAGSELKAKLERALNLTSHQNPKRELATVIEKGLDLLLADLEKKKLGKTDKPRRSRGTKPGDFSRRDRREIFERDGEQCTYVSPSGQRCQALAFLELDHRTARALGGQGTARNGRVLCRHHNAYEAEKVFGRKFIESRIHFRQRRLESATAPAFAGSQASGVEPASIAAAAKSHAPDKAPSHDPASPAGVAAAAKFHAPDKAPSQDLASPTGVAAAAKFHAPDRKRSPDPTLPTPPATSTMAAQHLDTVTTTEEDPGTPVETETLGPTGHARTDQEVNSPVEVSRMLFGALMNMGFRRAEARRAVSALPVQQVVAREPRRGAFEALVRQALSILVP